MKRTQRGKLIFITGTDTGVGKTVFTSSFVRFLRDKGVNAVAVKPFSSGGRGDAIQLHRELDGVITLDEVNPYFVDEPVAPALGSWRKNQPKLADLLSYLNCLAERFELVLVEGVGGVMVPLTAQFLVADVVEKLPCTVILVSKNQLGTLNHTLLTVSELKKRRRVPAFVVLMKKNDGDFSEKTNGKALTQLIAPVRVIDFPFLAGEITGERNKTFLQKTLAKIWAVSNVCTRRCDTKRRERKEIAK